MYSENLILAKKNIKFVCLEINKTKNAEIEDTLWRHKECPILIEKKKRCSNCQYLFELFKKYKLRIRSKRMRVAPAIMDHSYSMNCKDKTNV